MIAPVTTDWAVAAEPMQLARRQTPTVDLGRFIKSDWACSSEKRVSSAYTTEAPEPTVSISCNLTPDSKRDMVPASRCVRTGFRIAPRLSSSDQRDCLAELLETVLAG
jgi:hypothetical protein